MAKRYTKDLSIIWEKLFARGMAIASTSKQAGNAVSDAEISKHFVFKKGKMVYIYFCKKLSHAHKSSILISSLFIYYNRST